MISIISNTHEFGFFFPFQDSPMDTNELHFWGDRKVPLDIVS